MFALCKKNLVINMPGITALYRNFEKGEYYNYFYDNGNFWVDGLPMKEINFLEFFVDIQKNETRENKSIRNYIPNSGRLIHFIIL